MALGSPIGPSATLHAALGSGSRENPHSDLVINISCGTKLGPIHIYILTLTHFTEVFDAENNTEVGRDPAIL